MTEPRLLFIDIEPKSSRLSAAQSTQQNPARAEKRLWTSSDNSFKFSFFPGDSPVQEQETAASDGNSSAQSTGLTAFTGQGSDFAFNFQIPPVPPEDMNSETTAIQTVSPPDCQSDAKKQKPSDTGIVSPPSELAASSKAKKKKKSGKKKAPDSAGVQQKPTSAEGSQGDEGTMLTAEQQLERELDWCMEQLELGMRTQKGTPKQKDEASRALKTLRSSKAPLAKKRQVMRAMTGDYRKKMEEEKEKQLKLIQTAMTSTQIKVVPDSKKSVFHRRAGTKPQAADPEDGSKTETLQSQASTSNSSTGKQEEAPHFVFTPSIEQFCFNFLQSDPRS